jgi:hypothetical protein
MTVMADTFGERRKFTMETREVDNIHFRYDSLAGNELGNAAGRYAVEKFLTYTL